MDDRAGTEIRLAGYPVALGERQQEHLDEVTREFMLLSTGRPEFRERVPDRLLELLEALSAPPGAGLGSFLGECEQVVREDGQVDLVFTPAGGTTRTAVTRWQSMLQEIDDHCRQDELLALATPPDVVALRNWIVAEVLAQLDGRPPVPWPQAAGG